MLIQCVIQHQRAEVLDGIQRVAAAADDRAHIRTGNLQTKLVALYLRQGLNLTLNAHLCQQTGYKIGSQLFRLLHACFGNRDQLTLLGNGRCDRTVLTRAARTAVTAIAVAAVTARTVAALTARRTLKLQLFRYKVCRSSLYQTRRVIIRGDGQLLRLLCGFLLLRSRLFCLDNRLLLLLGFGLGRGLALLLLNLRLCRRNVRCFVGYAHACRRCADTQKALFANLEYLYRYIVALQTELLEGILDCYVTVFTGSL